MPELSTFGPSTHWDRVTFPYLAVGKVSVQRFFADANDASTGSDAEVAKPTRPDEIPNRLDGDIQAVCGLLYCQHLTFPSRSNA